VHPAFPAPSFLRDGDPQSSGASRRENADPHLLFEIRIEFPHCHCDPFDLAMSLSGGPVPAVVPIAIDKLVTTA
jgi:hypothetical protein